jgi:hypothetical protein
MSAFYDKVKENCNVDFGTKPITCSSQTYYTSADTQDAPAGITDLTSWLRQEAVRACRDCCGRKSQVNSRLGKDDDGTYVFCWCPGKGAGGDPTANFPFHGNDA